MSYATPKFSKKEIARAGAILAKTDANHSDTYWAFGVLSNYRSCHNYPMNTFQATLRMKLKKIDPHALVAIRLKRAPSIIAKLTREKGMSLARMQDIGGLRAIVKSISHVNKLHASYKKAKFSHELCGEKNYIANPKESGYRGIHLVYKYNKKQDNPYNGLRLEIQIRTKIQHAWATAVETLGTFLNHSLKSSEGPEEWLQFFSLASAAFSHLESSPPVPGYDQYSKDDIYTMTTSEALRLDVQSHLAAYSTAVKSISSAKSKGAYYLLKLDPIKRIISYRSYGFNDLEQANNDYLEAERSAIKTDGQQIVLVSASSIAALKRAYPNYFLDTHEFLKLLSRLSHTEFS